MLEFERLPVTEQGVTLPKSLFGQSKEVSVRRENGIVYVWAVRPDAEATSPTNVSTAESIWSLGSDPILDDPISDSSANHNQYE